jgi:adenine phosphoribosyltransferase
MTEPYVPPSPGEAGASNGRRKEGRAVGPVASVYVAAPSDPGVLRPLAPLPGGPKRDLPGGPGARAARPAAGPRDRPPRLAPPREEGRAALAGTLRAIIRIIPDFPRMGDRFPDTTPLLHAPELLRRVVNALSTAAEVRGAEAIAGIDPRGILFGPLVAFRLALPFVPIAAPGTLAGQIRTAEGRGEGAVPLRLAVHRGRLKPGDRVVLVDDLLLTGATAATAAGLVEDVGGIVAGLLFLAEDPDAGGRRALGRYNVFSILNLQEITSERT